MQSIDITQCTIYKFKILQGPGLGLRQLETLANGVSDGLSSYPG